MVDTAIADGKSFLRKTNAEGVSVYSHLTEVLATLLAQKPENALDSLEGVSLACKQKHYSAALTVPEAPPQVPAPSTAAAAASDAYHAANAALLTPKTGEEEAPFEGEIKDLLGERLLFQCAGVGLSKAESYRVYASLLALAGAKKLATVRFFGKVFGTGADYFVAEATYAEAPEPPEEAPAPPPGAPVEEPGTGCNTFVYFVATDPAGEWTVLPDVTPQQLVAAKTIRKYLTGDLSAPIRAYPPFPGAEKEFLRAQIARIAQAATLCASGAFKMDPEGEAGQLPAPNEDEDYVPAPTDAPGWCTRYYGILDIGRTVNPPAEPEELEEGEESKLPKPQPEIAPLAPIGDAEWSTTTFTQGGPAVAVARSLVWPGAYCAYQCVGKTATTASLYMGYGFETLAAPFTMLPPPPFEAEPDALVEQVDTPLDDENAVVIAAAKAALAEEAAALPDAEPEE